MIFLVSEICCFTHHITSDTNRRACLHICHINSFANFPWADIMEILASVYIPLGNKVCFMQLFNMIKLPQAKTSLHQTPTSISFRQDCSHYHCRFLLSIYSWVSHIHTSQVFRTTCLLVLGSLRLFRHSFGVKRNIQAYYIGSMELGVQHIHY